MTGYFSRLAHHTGLSFEPGAPTAGSFSTEPTVGVQRAEIPPPALPHVEEIAFTAAPAPGAVEGSSEGPPGVSPVGANLSLDRAGASAGAREGWNQKQAESKNDHSRSAEVTAKRSIDASRDISWEESRVAFTDAESGTRNSRGRFAEERSYSGEPRVVQPEEQSSAERQPAPEQSIAITRESISMVESPFAAQSPRAQGHRALRPEAQGSGPPEPTGVGESADAVRDEHLEREAVVHGYLEEVRAWVAAPPEPDQRELKRQRGAERQPAEPDNVFALWREAEPTGPRSGGPGAPEVQDLNLSIGTISIVIEEPKQTAPALLPAPPKVDRSPERASEPTRLSRYYLSSW